jgi:hypothetical protein
MFNISIKTGSCTSPWINQTLDGIVHHFHITLLRFVNMLLGLHSIEKKIIYSDNEWCEGLHKFIGKNVMRTQKLNAQYCKGQINKFFRPCASSICAPFFALHTSGRHSTLCQTFCGKRLSVFANGVPICSFKFFRVTGTVATWNSSFTEPHRKKV